MGSVINVAIAVVVAVVLLWLGFVVLRAMAQPVPEPPPPGELRKVKLVYRCEVCGTEVRMTAATDEAPEPPRHCMEEMTLVSAPD